ncbi:hypothetical protein HOD88_03180 [archaeon]|jgi:hypothetical protein|nr:hypothetical protein [archaeon]
MKGLRKLLGREKVSTNLSVEEARPFFKGIGINMDTIGFPLISESEGSHFIAFDSINARPVVMDGECLTIIKGRYAVCPRNTNYDSFGVPFSTTSYNFTIKGGKLNLKRRQF